MTLDRIKAIAESVLFAAGEPLPLRRLVDVIGASKADVKHALAVLRAEYSGAYRGVRLAQVAGGYQFRTLAAHAAYVKALGRNKSVKLSRAALETLAIIAYRQPLTKVEIEAIRGVDVDGVLHSLLSRKLIHVLGRKDVPGRPWIYGTSRQFLEVFNLRHLADLPKLPEIQEPSVNPYAQADLATGPPAAPSEKPTDGLVATSPEDSEPSRDHVAAGGRDAHTNGSGAGEWANDHATGNKGGSTTGPH